MMLVDVHAHLDFEEYRGKKLDNDSMIMECEKNNVKAIIAQGVNISSNRKVLELALKYKIIKPALGIYPTHCFEMIRDGKQKEFVEELSFIEKSIKERKAIAIGEVGLEYKEVEPTEENKKIMKECLRKFIELAKKYDVPIILHSRGAELDLIEFLEQEGMKGKKVIMHCFSGRKHLFKRIIDNGWYFSIPCTVVRTEHFQLLVKETPLDRLLTETDTPYLGPYPNEPNRPDNVKLTIKKIAEIKGMTEEEVTNIIYNNYQKMFK